MTKIVFFGSGPVAAKSLELIGNDFEIEAVVTKPKPKHHKGDFPVLDLASTRGYKTVLVSSRSDLDAAIKKHKFKSSLAILVDFGIIVSQEVIDAFPLGIVNSHFSILPQWRGADPISFAVLSGQPNTGVSLMLLVEKMDEGPLLAYGVYDLPKDITTPLLTEHLINFSAQLLKKEVPKYIKDQKTSPQAITGREVSYSRKLSKKDGLIDWNKPAEQIDREIRAFLGWPGSKTTLAGKDVTILKAHDVPSAPKGSKPGEVNTVVKETGEFAVTTGDGSLWIEKLKPAGKNEMTAAEFIRGYGSKL